jgi:hypothetical protein
VRYLLEGSVRKAGDLPRVNVQLASCETGSEVWGDRFDLPFARLTEGQDDIIRRIAVAMNVKMVDVESARSAQERPSNTNADLRARGRLPVSRRTAGASPKSANYTSTPWSSIHPRFPLCWALPQFLSVRARGILVSWPSETSSSGQQRWWLPRKRSHRPPRGFSSPRSVVIDTANYSWGVSLPGAIGLEDAGLGGNFSDRLQDRLGRKMQTLTKGDLVVPIIAVGWNSERFDGRNLVLRLIALGYTQVYWYRGGREAREVNKLPESPMVLQDW